MAGSSAVALVACSGYERAEVAQAVRRGLELLGPDALPSPSSLGGKSLLLKPNLLRTAAAEKGVTTHPSVFSAVAAALAARGFSLTYGDSPNGMFSPLTVARACGVHAEAEALGIPLSDFDNGDEVSFPGGKLDRRFRIARGVLEAGGIVNLPRLKTHGLTAMTGALKNMFGVIPGGLKAEYHITHPDLESFSRMIVDLNGAVPSRLVVLDAITVMEGNGPANGHLRPVGLLIMSTDPVAADALGCRVMGLDPLSILFIRMASEAGIGNAREESIRVVGEPLEGYVCADLEVRSRPLGQNVPPFLMRIAKDLIVSKPTIDKETCTGCGQCVEACPTNPKSLTRDGSDSRGIPRYLYSTCIRCYCCQETCPTGAVRIRRAPLAGIFQGRR
ncbi:MAG: DUF362 domain-containing protein [Spirochaetia bacterium]